MKFPQYSVYGVEVKDANEHHYVQKIADLLYPFVTEKVRKNDQDGRVRQGLARVALRAVVDARWVGKPALLP